MRKRYDFFPFRVKIRCFFGGMFNFTFKKRDFTNQTVRMKKDETASFVLRFTQKIFQSAAGEAQVQWRGNIRHVQTGDEKRFSEFENVTEFIREKLAELTVSAMEDKSPEEQKGIMAKSFEMWKKMALETPKLVVTTIKDPKKGMAQIQEQISHVGEAIGATFEEAKENLPDLPDLRSHHKEEHGAVMQKLEELTLRMEELSAEVKKLSKKK